MAIRLQGNVDWDSVWAELMEAAENATLQSISLDVNAPALHENYHARWDCADRAVPETHRWLVGVPLFAHGQLIGRLAVSGGRGAGSIGEVLSTSDSRLRWVSQVSRKAKTRTSAIDVASTTVARSFWRIERSRRTARRRLIALAPHHAGQPQQVRADVEARPPRGVPGGRLGVPRGRRDGEQGGDQERAHGAR